MKLQQGKATMRAHALAARRALDAPTRAAHSHAICTALARISELGPDSVVAGYAPLADEVDIRSFAEKSMHAGWSWCLPRVVARGQALVMHKISGKPQELVTGYGGIWQPTLDLPRIPLDKITAAIVPSISVDETGIRLGFGAGFYDITFSSMLHPPLLIAPIFSCQLMPSLPSKPHDLKVDIIVTENTTLRLQA